MTRPLLPSLPRISSSSPTTRFSAERRKDPSRATLKRTFNFRPSQFQFYAFTTTYIISVHSTNNIEKCF
uniref:Uncharacterized protein n=1 Tax=Daphnia magna TaxID=35525 RepID=A0A0P6C7J0_9CRUS